MKSTRPQSGVTVNNKIDGPAKIGLGSRKGSILCGVKDIEILERAVRFLRPIIDTLVFIGLLFATVNCGRMAPSGFNEEDGGRLDRVALVEQKRTLLKIDTIQPENVQIDRGAFYLDDQQNVRMTCVYSHGQWVWPDTGQLCRAGDPHWEINPSKEDVDYALVRHLAVGPTEMDSSRSYQNGNIHQFYRLPALPDFERFQYGFAMSLKGTTNIWFINSNAFPPVMKTKIPGAELHVHVGRVFSHKMSPKLMPGRNGRVRFRV